MNLFRRIKRRLFPPRALFEVVEVPEGFLIQFVDGPKRHFPLFRADPNDPAERARMRKMAEHECRLANSPRE